MRYGRGCKRAEAFERIELTELQRIIREELACLPDRLQMEFLASHYLHGQSYQVIADKHDCSREWARQIINKGLRQLRKSRRLRELYGELQSHSLDLALDRIIYSPEYFELIQQIKERQKREYLSYGKQQAILFAFMQKAKTTVS